MKKKLIFLLIIMLIFQAGNIVYSQTDPKFKKYMRKELKFFPKGYKLLFDCSDMKNSFQFFTTDNSSMQICDVKNMRFTKAFHIKTKTATPRAWDNQFVTINNQVLVSKGDVLLFIIYARALHGNRGRTICYMQLNKDPWTGHGSMVINPHKKWKRYYVVGKAVESYNNNKFNIVIHMGFKAQELQIGGILALKYPKGTDISANIKNIITYKGRKPDAVWRKAAEDRIEKYRKGDIRIYVKDSKGNPLYKANVHVEMLKHSFKFGSPLDKVLTTSKDDWTKHGEKFKEMFNIITAQVYWGGQNGKWGWDHDYFKDRFHAKAKWSIENGFELRGHPLIWPSWKWSPPKVKKASSNPEKMRKMINDHIKEVLKACKQYKIQDWDLINEPFSNHDIFDILGEEVIEEWFRIAHKTHPKGRYIINETGLLPNGGNEKVMANLERIVKRLIKRKVPIYGIGFQGHFGRGLTGMNDLYNILERFSKLGLKILITEFDINIFNRKVQADYTRDFITMCYSHPIVEKIIQWGIQEKYHWRPKGALYDKNWNIKPNGQAYLDLVKKKWWLNTTGKTDEHGKFNVRGHAGDYRIVVEKGSKKVEKKITLFTKGSDVEIIMD